MKRLCKLVCMILAITLLFSSCVGGSGTVNDEPIDEEYEFALTLGMFAVEYLKSSLNNPDSLKIYAIGCVNSSVFQNHTEVYYHAKKLYPKIDDIECIYKIDYSAENVFGGTSREYIYIAVEKDYDIVVNSGNYMDGTQAIEGMYDVNCEEYGRVLDVSEFNNVLNE